MRDQSRKLGTKKRIHSKVYDTVSAHASEQARVSMFTEQKAEHQILRLLRSNSFDIRGITMGRTVQNRLVGRRDMFYYQTFVVDETEARAGKIRLTSPNTDTSLEGADIERLVDQRGRPRNLGITWRETSLCPKVVFQVFRDGRINIKRMNIDEGVFLELVDIIIGVL